MRQKPFVPTFEPLERRDLMTGNLPTLTFASDVSQYTEQVQAAVSGLLPDVQLGMWQTAQTHFEAYKTAVDAMPPDALTNKEVLLQQAEITLASLRAEVTRLEAGPGFSVQQSVAPVQQSFAGIPGQTRPDGSVADNGKYDLGGKQTTVHTGWNRYGTILKSGVLVAVGNGSDHLVVHFPTPVTIRGLTLSGPGTVGGGNTRVLFGDATKNTTVLVSGTTMTVNLTGIIQISILNYTGQSLGIKEVQVDVLTTLAVPTPELLTARQSVLAQEAVVQTLAGESDEVRSVLLQAATLDDELEEFIAVMAREQVELSWAEMELTSDEYRTTTGSLLRAQTHLQRYQELRQALQPKLDAMQVEHAALKLAIQTATSQSTQNDARNAEALFMQRTGFPLLSERDALDTKIVQAQAAIAVGETARAENSNALSAQSAALTALTQTLSPVLELLPRAWITSLQRNNVQVHLTGKGPLTAYIDGPFYGSVLGSLTVQDLPLSGTGGVVSIRPESPAGTYTLHVRDASGTEVWSVELSWNGQQFTAAEADKFSETSFTNHVNLSRLPIGGNGSVEALLAEDLVSDEEASLLATIGTTVASQGRLLTNAQPGYSDVRNAFEWSMFDASRMAVTPEQIQGWWYSREPFMDPQNFAQWKASEALRLNITPAAFPQTYLQELGALEQRLHADWQDRWDRVNQDAGYYNTFLRTIAIPETLTAIARIQAGENEGTVMTWWQGRMALPYSAFQSYLTDTGWVRPSAASIWQNVLGMVRSGKAVDISANFNAQDAAYAEWNDNRMNKDAAIAELKEQLDRNEISLDDLSPGDRARIVQEEKIDYAITNQKILANKTALRIVQEKNAPESSPEKQARYVRAAQKAKVVLESSTDPQIVALREQNPQLLVSMLNNLKSELLNIEIVSMQTIAMAGESDGLAAGSVVIKEQTEDAVLGEVYSQEMLAAGVDVNTHSAAGRYFAEIVRQFWNAPTPQARTSIAQDVQAKTGISQWRVLQKVESNGNAFTQQAIAQNLRDLFAEAQYVSAFLETIGGEVIPVPDKYVGKDGLADVLTTYRTFDRTIDGHAYEADETVRVRFNVNVPAFHHARYYLLDENGAQVGNELPMKNGEVESGAGVLFAEFDAKEIGRRLESEFNGHGPLENGTFNYTKFSIRVVIWKTPVHEDRVYEETPEAKIEFRNEDIHVLELSVLPDTAENTNRRAIENVALTALKTHFPVGSGKTWRHTLGSAFHTGHERGAIDLNSSEGGNYDEDLPVTVIADGTIESIGLDYGTVRVKHTATINGTNRTWYSTYMHMRIVQTDRMENNQPVYEAHDKNGRVITTLQEGNALMATSVVGGVAGRGIKNGVRDDYAFSTHLHVKLEDDLGNIIHAGNALQQMNIQTYVLENDVIPDPATGLPANQIYLQWNDEIDEWVEGTHKLIYSQADAGTGLNNVWLAWHNDPTERRRVMWKQENEVGYPDGIFRFRDVGNTSKFWNGTDWLDSQILQ